jgi:alpha-L-arabinofuranosidase
LAFTLSFRKIGIYALFILGFKARAQDSITVRTGSVLNNVQNRPLGININYLMDGSYIKPSPAVPVTEALRSMGVRFLRFPGGEKADNYLWSVSPWTKSDPRFARTGSCEWPSNDSRFAEADYTTVRPEMLDFDEFMAMCKAIGAEPLIVVPYDAMYKPVPAGCQGTVPSREQLLRNAEEWVRYANIIKKHGIRYWMIGNESYNSSYNGSATPAQYRDDVIEFSRRMKAVDPSVKIIANGDKAAWWSVVLPAASAHIDFLGISNYPVWDYQGGFEYYRSNRPDLTGPVKTAINSVNSYAPAEHRGRLKVISTEYGAMDWSGTWPDNNDLGHALVSFEMLGDHLINPRVEAAIFWNTRWINNTSKVSDIADALRADGTFQASGTALSLWGNYLLDTMLPVEGSGNVRCYASYREGTGELNLFLINREASSRAVHLNLEGYIKGAAAEIRTLKGSGPSDTNPVLAMTGKKITQGSTLDVSLSPVSITVISLSQPTVTSVSFPGVIKELRVFPNPARDKVRIVYSLPLSGSASLKVFSTDGREVYSSTLREKEVTLETSSWSRGMYIIRIDNGQENLTSKLMLD